MPNQQTARLAFHYRVHGDPDGMPLLLLHGSYASSRWWLPFLEILPSEIYAVAPDLRGCGCSEKTPSGYGIEEQAEDVWALVQALGWSDFDLVGHSSSGAIAIELALHHGEHLRSLILVNTVPIEGVFTPLDTYLLLERMKTDRDLLAQALGALMVTAPASTMTAASFQVFFQQLVDDAQQMAPAAFTEIARSLDRWNRFQEARTLTLPTLLVRGDQDVIVDHDATTRTLIAIPGAHNLEVLKNTGHSPMIESPVALAERIIDFITEDFADYSEIRDMAGEQGAKDEQEN